MESKLSERSKIVVAVDPQDVGTADVTSAYFSAKGYKRFRAVGTIKSLTSGQTMTLQLLQAQAGGLNGKELAATITYTAPVSGGNGSETYIEANIEDFDAANGFEEIAVKIGSGTNSKVGAAFLEFGDPDHLPAS